MKEWLRNIQCHLFTTEEVVWIKGTVVGKQADGCTEVKAEMCGENKQHLFHIETEKVTTLPYLDQGHGAQQCPMEESLTLCNFYFCTSTRQVTRSQHKLLSNLYQSNQSNILQHPWDGCERSFTGSHTSFSHKLCKTCHAKFSLIGQVLEFVLYFLCLLVFFRVCACLCVPQVSW